ncbi:MAG TPA: hypothetical protein VEY95_11910 [Azospirillaceae bacterium]|nr:hypothetical protein [Azospirillaceae bacterium]
MGGVTDSVLQGLTFGFSDEIGAAGSLVGSTLKRWANGQELDIGGDYNRALEESRARLKGFEADYPWTSTIANVAGGFLMPGLGMARLATRAASLPGTIARTSTVGAGAGGLSGFGGGEGGIGARLEGAATGAVVGGALGGAAPVAATAGGRVVGAVADRTGSRARHAPTHASNSYGIFDPPELPPRPFSDDYPHRARRDGAGNLTHDIEGRPLRARPQRIAGRRVAEGPDEPIHWKEFDDIVKEGTGKPTKIEEIPEGDLGSTYYNVRTRRPTRVVIREGLPPDVAKRVHAHEIGHVIDQLARGIKIPTKNINDELEKVYHQLGDNTSRRLEDNVPRELMTLPEKTFGYSKKDAPRELWAEGIRAYMTNPSYFKHEAPRAAALIRKVVNRNPKISGIIQFNTMAPVALATGAAPMGLLDPYLGGAEPRNHQRSLLEFIANQDLDKMGR